MIDIASKKRIICLEGLSGAGKTGILEMFRENPSFSVITEIVDPIPEDVGQIFYLENDQSKATMALEAKIDVIIDRGFGSSIAHDYALKIIDGNEEVFKTSLRYYNQAKEKGLLPDVIIYIDIEPETSIKRKNRPISDDIWTQKRYLTQIRKFYKTEMGRYFPNTKIINVSGEDIELEDLYKVILKSLL
ncbi:MAG: hypothetical protein WCR68_01745 [Candidatus Dojkabacteria bacterium]|jgi:thymidylate kinase|nr:deoxynucleoside kinase [Candidatus Dojkabacteria bacterium]